MLAAAADSTIKPLPIILLDYTRPTDRETYIRIPHSTSYALRGPLGAEEVARGGRRGADGGVRVEEEEGERGNGRES